MPHYYSRRQPKRKAERIISFIVKNIAITLETSPNVFSKNDIDPGTRLLLEDIVVPEKGVVLDLGTGTGVIGIFLAKTNPFLKVYMTDINPLAIRLARLNAKINNVINNVVVLESDLYDKLDKHFFDAIYTNPPISAGWETLAKIIREAPVHLKENGFLMMVLYRGEEKAVELGKKVFVKVTVIKRKKGYSIIKFDKKT